MPTASQLTPPTRGTTAEPHSTATDAAVTKRVGRKRGAPRGKHSIAATESRSRRQASRVKDHWQATRRLRHAFFRRLERRSGDPAQRSHPVLRLGGLAKKENFSKQNKQIAGNGGGGGGCQRNTSFSSHHSDLERIRLFQATIETVLLYGAEAWILTKGLERALDGTYTRLLWKAMHDKDCWRYFSHI